MLAQPPALARRPGIEPDGAGRVLVGRLLRKPPIVPGLRMAADWRR